MSLLLTSDFKREPDVAADDLVIADSRDIKRIRPDGSVVWSYTLPSTLPGNANYLFDSVITLRKDEPTGLLGVGAYYEYVTAAEDYYYDTYFALLSYADGSQLAGNAQGISDDIYFSRSGNTLMGVAERYTDTAGPALIRCSLSPFASTVLESVDILTSLTFYGFDAEGYIYYYNSDKKIIYSLGETQAFTQKKEAGTRATITAERFDTVDLYHNHWSGTKGLNGYYEGVINPVDKVLTLTGTASDRFTPKYIFKDGSFYSYTTTKLSLYNADRTLAAEHTPGFTIRAVAADRNRRLYATDRSKIYYLDQNGSFVPFYTGTRINRLCAEPASIATWPELYR